MTLKPLIVKKGPFQNERFRFVTINREGDSVRVQGEAQIFEASFSYTIEDGHNILAEGHATTDAGAPAWGRFDFTTYIPQYPTHLTPHIILFEASAKDMGKPVLSMISCRSWFASLNKCL
ncbi:MAG: hypothetical protein EOO44_20660, partial [Flavobacterium sp.]